MENQLKGLQSLFFTRMNRHWFRGPETLSKFGAVISEVVWQKDSRILDRMSRVSTGRYDNI
jgi:hypothetical protein